MTMTGDQGAILWLFLFAQHSKLLRCPTTQLPNRASQWERNTLRAFANREPTPKSTVTDWKSVGKQRKTILTIPT